MPEKTSTTKKARPKAAPSAAETVAIIPLSELHPFKDHPFLQSLILSYPRYRYLSDAEKKNAVRTTAVFLCSFHAEMSAVTTKIKIWKSIMEFFYSSVDELQTLVIALGAGLAVWGVINLLVGYGSDNAGAKSPVCIWEQLQKY